MQDYSEFLIILDRSGSMQQAASDHEGGLNSFIQDQAKLPGDVRITLIQFDGANPCEILFDGVHASKVTKIVLIPRGATPLHDAIGMSLAHFSKRIDAQQSKPDIVVVMIITDGLENTSREWTKQQIKGSIGEKEKLGWKFLYLGANVDAFDESSNIGIQTGSPLQYINTTKGVQNLYGSISSGSVCARIAIQQGQTPMIALSGFAWTEEQKLAAIGKGSCTCIGTISGDVYCPIHRKELLMKGAC